MAPQKHEIYQQPIAADETTIGELITLPDPKPGPDARFHVEHDDGDASTNYESNIMYGSDGQQLKP